MAQHFKTALNMLDALLATEEHWTTRALAVDAQGHGTTPGTDDAVKFCLAGAAIHVARTYQMSVRLRDALERTADRLFKMGVFSVNDQLGFPAVRQVIDAIRRES